MGRRQLRGQSVERTLGSRWRNGLWGCQGPLGSGRRGQCSERCHNGLWDLQPQGSLLVRRGRRGKRDVLCDSNLESPQCVLSEVQNRHPSDEQVHTVEPELGPSPSESLDGQRACLVVDGIDVACETAQHACSAHVVFNLQQSSERQDTHLVRVASAPRCHTTASQSQRQAAART